MYTRADGARDVATVTPGSRRPAAAGRPEVAAGRPDDDAERVPLAYAGERVGELRVGARAGGYSRSERRLLDGLSRQAAVAVHGLLSGVTSSAPASCSSAPGRR